MNPDKEQDASYEDERDYDVNNTSKELDEDIIVPKGWRVEPSKYNRKCFVNDFNKDKVRLHKS